MSEPYSYRLRITQLNANRPLLVDLTPDADQRAAIAADLGLLDLPALTLKGQLRPIESGAWELVARVNARVVQPCVITLAPVETALDESVHRIFSPYATTPEGEEVEMPDDDIEPLGNAIDLGAIATESLSLALPEYPRAAGAHLDPPANADGHDEASRRPFADLANLLKPKG